MTDTSKSQLSITVSNSPCVEKRSDEIIAQPAHGLANIARASKQICFRNRSLYFRNPSIYLRRARIASVSPFRSVFAVQPDFSFIDVAFKLG
jgi:hypothetical protein